jgi:hypothetical protein
MSKHFAARRLAVAVLLGGLFAAAPTGVAHAATKKPCVATGSETIVRNAKVRVYEVGKTNRRVFACLLRTSKRIKVAEYTSVGGGVGDEPQPKVWLTREAVAVNDHVCPPDASPCTGDVASFDVRRRAEKYTETAPGGIVSDLVLKSNGSFAYISGDTVRKADGAGIGQLDPGPAIEAGSLARAGSTVYWTKSGQPFSAKLQ